MTAQTNEANASIKWGVTIEKSPEGYAFATWNWYTGETIHFGSFFYRSFDRATEEARAMMQSMGYELNNGIGLGSQE